jgi:outer membrane receptor protein involved in Fe transport
MEPYGAEQGPIIAVLNLKGSKRFPLGRSRLEATVEVFNALNSSAATALTYLSGPSFGFVTGVVPPRVARFGFSFNF